MKIFRRLFNSEKKQEVTQKEVNSALKSKDPLDIFSRKDSGWDEVKEPIQLKRATDFAIAVKSVEVTDGIIDSFAMDSASVADPGCGVTIGGESQSAYSIPGLVADWYVSQGFIGYQMCAIIAQHWLVDKACSQSVEDSVRNGWTFKPDIGSTLSNEQKIIIDNHDIKFKVKENLMEYGRFANIFGIRVMIFVVESEDPNYYTKPFNPDGVTKGSYKGMSQIDPYWMTPMLTNESMSNPASIGFYEPDYWVINGKKYHKSHLCIARGPQPADILKPTYIFGGIPLTQRIYERVYAAERTANEAPLLAMNKRTTAIHVDLDKVAADEPSFVRRLMMWVKYRDNHGVKVLGKEETMEQFDTSLADFDNVIMNQYQIVAATAKTPSTKLLGTSPKGFNATGEFETVSYHEELETIEERWMTPVLDRHYLCLSLSLGLGFGLNVAWEPVDSMSSEKQADINTKKVTDAVNMIAAGMISPDEGRDKLAQDRDSGWNNLSMLEDANTEKGASPENIAELEKAGAEKTAANNPSAEKTEAPAMDEEPGTDVALPPAMIAALGRMGRKLDDFIDEHEADRDDNAMRGQVNRAQNVKSSVRSIDPAVSGINSVIESRDEKDLPKIRILGVTAVVENPKNSVRKGNSISGPWQIKMPHHYGYINNSTGSDGDEIDCFIGPDPKSKLVFVVNQKDANSGEFDEHKVMLGFSSKSEAKKGYLSSFEKGWKGFFSIVEISPEELRKWVTSSSEEQPLDGPYLESTNTDGPVQG